jgi:hypothetical protein
LLAAAIGPSDEPEEAEEEAAGPTAPADPATGLGGNPA